MIWVAALKLERVEDINESEDDDSASHSDESLADEADTESHRDEKVNIEITSFA